jgi:hypothetical protein
LTGGKSAEKASLLVPPYVPGQKRDWFHVPKNIRENILKLPAAILIQRVHFEAAVRSPQAQAQLRVIFPDDSSAQASIEELFKLLFHLLYYVLSTNFFSLMHRMEAFELAFKSPDLKFIKDNEMYQFLMNSYVFSECFKRRPEYFRFVYLN